MDDMKIFEHMVKIHRDSLKKYQIGKRNAMMVYMDSGNKNVHASTTDWFCNKANDYKKQA